ncbi:aldo/keto reductase [Winogradskyella sp. SM1960]|uniref:aldo/keto reductase n=1 Tax=Winogradskyella sp. SM1960 TaxID=2865955 RepID=UPI001CD7DCE1|nr:aldo/keto reductase [Winogradskyella sp. SM1960]
MDFKTKIGLGTVQFGTNYGISNFNGQTSDVEVGDILDSAYRLGLKVIDTAAAYGEAENVIGHFDMARFKVVSKFMPPNESANINSLLQKSLDKLQTDRLYGFLAHRPMQLLSNPEQWEELLKLKNENKIKKIGFSLNAPEEIDLLLSKGFMPDLIQVPYNYFDNRFENSMIALKESGCEIHTRSTFLQGLFFLNPDHLNPFFKEVKPLIKSLQENNEYLASSLLVYSLKKEFIDKVIIGVETNNQLIQNLNTIEKAKSLPKLNSIIEEKILNPSLWEK